MSKDWIGREGAGFRICGASNHSDYERQNEDFYATDPTAIDDLLKLESFDKNIWECAVGQGHLAYKLKEYGHNVKCSDLVDRGYEGTEIFDFINQHQHFDGDIITNPPYKYCTEFILNALDSINEGNKVAMFLKLQTLEGANRYKQIYSITPPKKIYVYVRRKKCCVNGDFTALKTGSAICYAWYVWQKGYKGETTLEWIF